MQKLRKTMNELGLDPRKEAIFFLLGILCFVGLGVAVYLWKGFGFLLLFPAIGLLLFAFWFLSRYGNMRKAKLERMNAEFVELFTYFGVYITDGLTVYNSLEKIKGFASEDMKERLETLLRDIDEDKSVSPFVTFASGFEDVAVKEVLLSVYQMVDEGVGGVYIRQFQRLFGKLSDNRHEMEKQKRLGTLDTLSFLPLAGAGIAMLSLTVSIVEIMGGLLNVL